MKLTVAIPVMNQLEDTKGQWGCHLANIVDKANVEILIINNGSTDGTVEFIENIVFPMFADHKMINNPENIGVLASMQQCVNEARGDVIAILHNDLYVYTLAWDQWVLKEFRDDPLLGLAGFLGSEGVGNTGGRANTMSNMLEAEIHGNRIAETKEAIIFDGMSLIGRKEMFEKVGGFDQGYTYHHFYDRDISLSSFKEGYKNKVIPAFCHHRSGITANRPDYQQWIDKQMGTNNYKGDLASYQKSEQYFINKWQKWIGNQIRWYYQK